MKYYIAYGSNTPQEMVDRCPDSVFLGVVELVGYELIFSRYATIRPSFEKTLKVALYLISDEDERNLDYYEGYPDLYKKVEVIVGYKTDIRAMVYIMNDKYLDYTFPSNDYLFRCASGYKKMGIPLEQLLTAIDVTAKNFLEACYE